MRLLPCAMLAAMATAAQAEGPVLDLPGFPDYAILGTGAGPRYPGSDETVWAVVPAARKSFGARYVSLEANYLSINLLDQPNWKAGPAGILRFGRGEADDPAIDALPDIAISVDLGGFVAWETGGADPRDRWRIGAGVLQDATGVHDGYVADLNLRRWLPVGRYGALGLGLAASWASEDYMDTYFSVDARASALSGLPSYSAGAGWRDARITAIYVQPVSRHWAVGAGLLYAHLLDGAADSPVTASRGQLFGGVGIARAW
ncbi:MipA/OmpV family protein [Poseidonocella sp. HB161398]|uniref:MipA/OmpV family protein n=1 Tax=Poseidonocella sp. HB161398 TaxID=2320855 RepID=UPI00148625A0|nr:MipA/OmpV family protein [Poseidonocella sp. HB161398]